jgi:hypothetical protein
MSSARTARRLAAFAASATLVAACGGGDKGGGGLVDPNSPGVFSGNVSGAFAHTAKGQAEYVTGTSSALGVFYLYMGSLDRLNQGGTGGGSVVWAMRLKAGVPGAGTYQIGSYFAADDAAPSSDDFYLIGVYPDGRGNYYVCGSTGGTLRVTSTANDRVKGEFDATAECQRTDADAAAAAPRVAARLAGSFDAKGGTFRGGPNVRVRPGALEALAPRQ